MEKSLLTILPQIKSLSNYLLILVKDFDYFSQSQLMNNIEMEFTSADLDEILIFCQDTANALLKKSGKYNEIKFILNKSEGCPKTIKTDYLRLKQCLINLISNSIKFTNTGKIELIVTIEPRTDIFNSNINGDLLLKFLIKDTGVGIKDKSKLFEPFKKSSDGNKLGAGLGLSIVKDITSKLGENFNFESEQYKGSSFWFYIPIDSNSIESLKNSENNLTIKRNRNSDVPSSSKKIDFKINKGIISKNNSKDNLNAKLSSPLIEENITPGTDSIKTVKASHLDLTISNDKYNSVNFIFNDNIQYKYNTPSPIRKISKFFNNRLDNIISEENINKLDPVKKASQKSNFFPRSNFINTQNINIYNNLNTHNSANLEMIEDNLDNKYIEVRKERSKSDQDNYDNNDQDKARAKNKSDSQPINIIINNGNSSLESFLQIGINTINIIVVDDEQLTRQSTTRLLKKLSKSLGIPINIVEAEDGAECIYITYKCFKKGIKISCIFSDETMNFMKGSNAAEYLYNTFNSKNLNRIPFYLVTAYEDKSTLNKLNSDNVDHVFSKPLRKENVENILKDFYYHHCIESEDMNA